MADVSVLLMFGELRRAELPPLSRPLLAWVYASLVMTLSLFSCLHRCTSRVSMGQSKKMQVSMDHTIGIHLHKCHSAATVGKKRAVWTGLVWLLVRMVDIWDRVSMLESVSMYSIVMYAA